MSKDRAKLRSKNASMHGSLAFLFASLVLSKADAFLPTPSLIARGKPARLVANCGSTKVRAIATVSMDPITEISLLAADIAGFKPAIIAKESWAWSHTSRLEESVILDLTKRIEEEGGKDQADPALLRMRRRMMSLLLQHDYSAYVQSATVLGGLIDRKDLPNVQDIPYPTTEGMSAQKTPQVLKEAERAICCC
jgi:hypothetical protein